MYKPCKWFIISDVKNSKSLMRVTSSRRANIGCVSLCFCMIVWNKSMKGCVVIQYIDSLDSL